MGGQMKGFLLYASYMGPVSALTDEEAGRLFKAILAYANGEEMPEMGGSEAVAFSFIRAQLDQSRENYERRCEVNRANGAKGGRPRKGAKDREREEDAEEREEKEKKREAKPKPEKKQYAEFVTMTEAEHDRLVERYGKAATDRMVEILDNYKGLSKSNQRRYDSDYRAILSWVVDRYEEEQERKSQSRRPASGQQADTSADWESFYKGGYE